MEKRLALTLALSAIILFGWMWLQQKYFPAPTPTVTAPASTPEATPPAAPLGTPAQPGQPGAPPSPDKAATGAAPRLPKEEVTVTRAKFRAKFSTWGAAPIEFTLLDPQYKMAGDEKNPPPVNLIPAEDKAGVPPYLTYFASAGEDGARSDFDLPRDAAWKLERQTEGELLYTIDVAGLHVEKKWTLPQTGYALGLDLTVENRGDASRTGRLIVEMNGYQDPHVEQRGMLSFGRRINLTDAECDIDEKVHRITWSAPSGCSGGGGTPSWSKPVAGAGDVRWAASTEQFFMTAVAFGPSEGGSRTCHLDGQPSGRVQARIVFAEKSFAPHSKVSFPMAAFAGPKLLHELEAVTVPEPNGEPARLDEAVNYGWTLTAWIARPLLKVLKAIQSVVRNWGVAIILITILLKLLTLYPTQKSMVSMKKMAKLKPQIDAIKTRFPDDQARQQQETMALYKKNDVSMFGGCLPMLIQMPIYIGFYSMLSNAVELYRSSFIPPIRDMTAPFWPMALVTGGLMYLQQRLSPTAGDPQQAKMMQMMPIIFMAMTMFLPAGLTLYILTNTVLSMVHQWWMNRNDPDARKGPAKKPGKPEGKPPLKPARA